MHQQYVNINNFTSLPVGGSLECLIMTRTRLHYPLLWVASTSNSQNATPAEFNTE